MNDEILAIGIANLVFGVLALTIAYLYTLPHNSLPAVAPAPLAHAIGEQ